MKFYRIFGVLILPLVLSSCAAMFTGTGGGHGDMSKVCSDTPKGTATKFIQGMKEFSLSLLRAAVPEGMSLFGVFGGNDEERGQEVVKHLTAHPEIVGANRSCACYLHSMEDTPDPLVKKVEIKRVSLMGDGEEMRDYKRAFLVSFTPGSNCITSVSDIDGKWIRI